MKEINIDKSFFYNKKETINISQKKIWVNDDEFNIISHEEFTNLILYENLNILKNEIGFYLEFLKTFLKSNKMNLYFFEPSHGGYVILEILTNLINIYSEVSAFNLNVFIICKNQIQRECLEKNLEFYKNNEWINLDENYPISIQLLETVNLTLLNAYDTLNIHIYNQKILNNSFKILGNFLDFSRFNDNKNQISIKDNNIYILESFEELEYNKYNFTIYNFKDKQCFIPKKYTEEFQEEFHYFLDNHVINFKNTIHYTMIVKNAGNILEEVLTKNYDNIDQWTILDTGSTDNTTEIIKKILVGKKKGTLYYEPFKDFKQSRNLCLDFAKRTNYCDFCIMLDDTYVLDGNIREFLEIAKKDQFADSFSLYIQSDDTQYVSNRITKLDRNLRYIYKIHEVIQQKNNKNVIVPINWAKIIDLRSDYMEKRTMNRKEFDLKLLFDEYEENPNDPRALYYIGQTYNLLEKYELAYKYYLERANHSIEGFLQEKIDSIFEAARMANYKLNKPWDECLKLYEWAYSLDKSRPDSLYFIGIHHYLENNFKIAYDYFKRAYKLGYPIHCQYSLKPTLSFYYCPKLLGHLCYQMNDFKLGEEVCKFFLENNKPNGDYYNIMRDWYIIYNRLNSRTQMNKNPIKFEKELFIFVADGGFKSWSGSSIEKEGVGGSETWIIETARYIRKNTDYHVIVFCNTPNNSVEFYKNVEYRPLQDFFNVCMNYEIKHCIISRFSEYIPVAIHSLIENIYFIIHDLTPSGQIIPIHPKLRKIFCLTEWHKSYFLERFSQFIGITDVCSYGIDLEKFDYFENQKVKNSFIYSSYPNRGLLELLQIWPKIIQKYSNASLNIYSDINNKWSNENYPEMMQNIRELLDIFTKNEKMNINYYGWVDKKTLSLGWSKAEYWLYPCVFAETFCLTALEAAASKTLAICNDLGALVNTVGNRGVIQPGDARTVKWQEEILDKLFYYMDDNNRNEREILLNKNYEWAKSISWESRTKDLLNRHILHLDLTINNQVLPKKNLIFITVFYQKEYLKLLELLFKSIYLFGNIKHRNNNIDIIIYTNSDFKTLIEKENKYTQNLPIKFLLNDSITTIEDACKARYSLFNFDIIRNYDKILYLDIDILIFNDLNRVFDLCIEDKMYVVSEKLNSKGEVSYWGKELYLEETEGFNKQIAGRTGFNSGVLLFKNSGKMKTVFSNVLDDMIIRRHLMKFYDQPFLNYHINRNNLADTSVLNSYSININNEVLNNTHLYENKSILHFYLGVGNTENKLEIMREFLNNKIEQLMEEIIKETKEIIRNELLPIIKDTGEKLEGSFFNNHLDNSITDIFEDKQKNLCNILLDENINNVLEIGFNAGFSTLLMLIIRKDIKITCVDICSHKYTELCFEWLNKKFPNRIKLLKGDSLIVLKELIGKETFGLIHIDGGHNLENVFNDCENTLKLAKKNSFIVMDDYDMPVIFQVWNLFISHYNLIEYPVFIKTVRQDIRKIP